MLVKDNNIYKLGQPVAAPYGLLGGATNVVNLDESSDEVVRRFNYILHGSGISAETFSSEGSNLGDNVDAGSLLDFGALEGMDSFPVDIEFSVESSTISSTPGDVYKYLETSLNYILSNAIERAFWGSELFGRGLVTDAEYSQHNSTAEKPRRALARVEKLGASHGFKPTLHMSRELASILKLKEYKDEEGVLSTNLRTPVIAGSGYGLDDQSAEYIFATGPVTVVVGNTHVQEYGNVASSKNTIKYSVLTSVTVLWNTQNLYSATVDLNSDYS